MSCLKAWYWDTYYKGGVRADGAEIVPNDAPEIMNLLKELWATGCTQKVAEGVLAAESIWGENLNNIPGLTAAVKADLDSIQEKGMLETVYKFLEGDLVIKLNLPIFVSIQDRCGIWKNKNSDPAILYGFGQLLLLCWWRVHAFL